MLLKKGFHHLNAINKFVRPVAYTRADKEFPKLTLNQFVSCKAIDPVDSNTAIDYRWTIEINFVFVDAQRPIWAGKSLKQKTTNFNGSFSTKIGG